MDVAPYTQRPGDLPAQLVLALIGELSAALEAMRREMAQLRAPGAAPAPAPVRIPQALQGQATPGIDLTKRHRQVLAGIVRGCPNKVIAWELGLSVRTVEAYRAQLFERLGARNTADAVRLALAAGFVGDEALAGPSAAPGRA